MVPSFPMILPHRVSAGTGSKRLEPRKLFGGAGWSVGHWAAPSTFNAVAIITLSGTEPVSHGLDRADYLAASRASD